MLLSAIVGLSLLTGFVLVSHSQMSDFQKAFKKKGTKKLRQNVNTVQQVLAAAYLKVFCSVTSLRFVKFHLYSVLDKISKGILKIRQLNGIHFQHDGGAVNVPGDDQHERDPAAGHGLHGAGVPRRAGLLALGDGPELPRADQHQEQHPRKVRMVWLLSSIHRLCSHPQSSESHLKSCRCCLSSVEPDYAVDTSANVDRPLSPRRPVVGDFNKDCQNIITIR